jgi:4-cresol dehydrogenase (hydroxylating) flavoprotein subunit
MKSYSLQEKIYTLQQVLPLKTASLSHKNLGEFPGRKIHGYLQTSHIKDLRTLLEICALPGDLLPIYPYSSGKNWGLGSHLPVQDSGILLDLSPMNKIVSLDLKAGLAFIESGVTQLQLSQALDGTPYMLNVTSSHTTTAILGNALDRGVGFHRQRTQDLIGAEVMLSTGETLHLGGYGALVHGSYPHGLGPNLLPLLFQSNLGIVTKGVIALIPRPEKIRVFKITFPMEQFNAVVDTFRQLYRDDIVSSVMKIYNASAAHMYSGGSVSSQTFHGYFSLEGVQSVVREKMFHVEHFCKNFVLGEIDAETTEFLDKMIYHCFHGNPAHNDVMINASFKVQNGDLDRQSPEGWISFLPIVPLNSQSLHRAFELMHQCVYGTSVRPMATMNILSKDIVDLVIALRFQREPQAIAEAHQVLDRLYESFAQEGFYPYRLDVGHMDFVAQQMQNRAYIKLLQGIKEVFDPEGIMLPGRYGL